MNKSANKSVVFWQRIQTLTDIDDNSSIAELQSALLGIDEGFAGQFDPVDAYAEYLTVSLCRKVRRITELLETNSRLE